MKQLVNNLLNRHNLNLDGQKVIIGVSTGIDSMALLSILESLNLDIIVCHVNHKMRKASENEEEFIRKYCLGKNLKLYVKSLAGYDFSNRNFQEAARELRMDFFREVAKKENSKYLFLAHHLNDDIETFFMRLLRGSSIEAMGGIKDFYIENDLYIIRPLLSVLKSDIINYSKDNDVLYFEDESNRLDDYTRNRIRHNIVPEIFKEEPNFALKFLDFKEFLEYSSSLIKERVSKAIKSHLTINEKSFSFNRKAFLELEVFIQKEVLFEMLYDYKFSKKNIEEIIKYINSTKSNLVINYKSIGFIKEYNLITIVFDNVSFEDVNLIIDEVKEYQLTEKHKILVSKNNNVILANQSILWYNSKDLPVVIRRYESGDSISLGFGTKKVARILIDKKVPITQRKNTFVLEKDNVILGVFNHARSILLTPKEECDIVIELKGE